MTDDSDMDVRLGMEGSASLAAESTWPPWEDKAGIGAARTQLGWGVPTAWPEGTCVVIQGGMATHASQLIRTILPPSPTMCPNLVNKADSITDIQLVVNIPDLIPQPVGRFPHQELAQVLLVELLPPAMM